MNRGDTQGGYTIVEVLIFLAVSAVMFGSAMGLISGRQNRAMFVNSVRDFESKISDIANNISTGYYVRPAGITCQAGPNGPQLNGGDKPGDCILLGSVIKFGDNGSKEGYSTVTMVGLRQSGAEDVATLGEATPQAVPGTVQQFKLPYGSSISCVAVGSGACNTTGNAGLGFFTTFNTAQSGGGSLRADTLVFSNLGYTANLDASFTAMSHGTSGSTTNYSDVTNKPEFNPAEGIRICLLSGTTNQYALVHIGQAGGSQLSTTTEIREGTSCAV